MKTKNIAEYVSFGRIINYLRFTKADWPYHTKYYVKDNIEQLIEYLDDLNLIVTSNVEWFIDLKNLKATLDLTKNNYKLTDNDADNITSLMDNLSKVISAELRGRIVFVITEKRINVENLLDNVKDIFAQDVYNNLPDLPRFDFSEGGKCIAFERTTAGAFHILRGMEGIIRWFFDKLSGSSGCTDNWGSIIRNLRSLSSPPPVEILDQLDAIRVNYRNPTAHPELIYTTDDSQDLFSECIAVVNRIVHHLKDSGLL